MKIRRIDHVSVIVHDLAAAKAFFIDLGLEILGEGDVEGASVDRVVGLDNVKSTIVMMGVPGSQTNIELVQFLTPPAEGGMQHLPANALGIRHIAFAVEEIDAIMSKLREHGAEPFSEI